MNLGDLVTRRSYGGDIIFKIESITGAWATLRGVEYRLLADSPVQDLTLTDARYFWTRTIRTQPQVVQSMHKMEDYRTSILKKRRCPEILGSRTRDTSNCREKCSIWTVILPICRNA